VVLAVAMLLELGRVVANAEGESCLISYALGSDPRAARFEFVQSLKSVQLGWSVDELDFLLGSIRALRAALSSTLRTQNVLVRL